MPELAPPASPRIRRGLRLQGVRRREEQISILIAQQRLELAALATEDLAGLSSRYVPDEYALACGLSVRQARNRQDEARMFAEFPAVHAKIGDGTWLIVHADAVLGELVGSGLERDQQQQVLDLVLSRDRGRTPYELRQAVRTAMVVQFPAHALERAEKAKVDRNVQTYVEAPGVATLLAHGPAAAVAAMWASLDALTFPPAPDDTRSADQRRFDTLQALVCGQAQPGQWQAHLLVTLATVAGEEDLPGEIPGFGPISTAHAREIVAGASLRRVVVDEHGQLVAVDGPLHRPDLPPEVPAARVSDQTPPDDPDDEHLEAPADEPDVPERDMSGPTPARVEADDDDPEGTGGILLRPCPDHDDDRDPLVPEPEPPSADDLDWFDDCTDLDTLYSHIDAQHEATGRRSTAASSAPRMQQTRPGQLAEHTPPSYLSWQWSAAAFTTALHRVRTDPLRYLDLSSDRYAISKRLRRFLELRDRTCVFPGCFRLARRCDKDHLLPWPRGSTSAINLANECEHHHQGKHDCLSVQRLPDGTFRWATPCGITADRPPRPVLDAWAYRRLPEAEG